MYSQNHLDEHSIAISVLKSSPIIAIWDKCLEDIKKIFNSPKLGIEPETLLKYATMTKHDVAPIIKRWIKERNEEIKRNTPKKVSGLAKSFQSHNNLIKPSPISETFDNYQLKCKPENTKVVFPPITQDSDSDTQINSKLSSKINNLELSNDEDNKNIVKKSKATKLELSDDDNKKTKKNSKILSSSEEEKTPSHKKNVKKSSDEEKTTSHKKNVKKSSDEEKKNLTKKIVKKSSDEEKTNISKKINSNKFEPESDSDIGSD